MPPAALDIAQDLEFQRRQWRFERLGALALAAVLGAAALGLFGPGVFNRARVTAARGALVVQHPRFARMQAPLHLRVEVRPDALATDRDVRIWLSADYLARLTVQQVTPEPEDVELGASGITYVFAWDGSPGTAVLSFDLEARGPGAIRGAIGTSAEDAVALGHFIYP
jgi:hypothetical protein